MLLVVCALNDLEALRFAQHARADGVRCEVLTGEALSFAHRRSHRLATSGDGRSATTSSTIEVLGMPVLDSASIDGVLNRLTESPTAAWHYASAMELNYATAEMHAFVLSWLTSLPCPVRNRPSGESLSGPALHPLMLVGAAHRAGLRTPAVRWPVPAGGPVIGPGGYLQTAAAAGAGAQARPISVACLDGTALSPDLPPDVAAGITRLAADLDLGQALVSIDFQVRADRWVFAGLDPRPPLPDGDGMLYRRLLDVLTPLGVS